MIVVNSDRGRLYFGIELAHICMEKSTAFSLSLQWPGGSAQQLGLLSMGFDSTYKKSRNVVHCIPIDRQIDRRSGLV